MCKNVVTINETDAIIHVLQQNGTKHEILVSLWVIPHLEGYRLKVGSNRTKTCWYAYASKQGETFLLHRLIMSIEDPVILVDHIDGNGLNCKDDNLRLLSNAQNGQNRLHANSTSATGLRNVYFDNRRNNYYCEFDIDKIRHRLGAFKTIEEADTAAKEFRRLNMPFSQEAL